jgi:hypothetical protein
MLNIILYYSQFTRLRCRNTRYTYGRCCHSTYFIRDNILGNIKNFYSPDKNSLEKFHSPGKSSLVKFT